MQAVVLKGFGNEEQFVLKEVSNPEPIENQMCIRIKAAGFNPVDWKIREGWYGGNPPEILGCDCSGVVEKLGSSIKDFSVGEEVYAMSFIGTGKGSYAQYACVPRELVAKKPNSLSFKEAAAIPLTAMTAYRATIANRAFQKDDIVFVAGIGGGVGSFATQFLKQIGVKEIYTIAKNQESAQAIAKNLGIDPSYILVYDGLDSSTLKDKLVQMNQGSLFNATLDLVGGDMKKLCLELTGHSGHFSTILPEEHFEYPFWGENDLPRFRNLSVHQVNIGSEFGSVIEKDREIYVQHFVEISQMFENGRLKPPSIQIVGNLSAETVKRAHDLLESKRTKGKLVMEVT